MSGTAQRRPRPAARARQVTAVVSSTALVGLTGAMAFSQVRAGAAITSLTTLNGESSTTTPDTPSTSPGQDDWSGSAQPWSGGPSFQAPSSPPQATSHGS